MEFTGKELRYLTEGITLLVVKNYRELGPDEAEEAFHTFGRVVRLLTAFFPENFTAAALLADPVWLMAPATAECYYLLKKDTKDAQLQSLTYSEFEEIVAKEVVAMVAVRLFPIALELLLLIPRLPMIELIDEWDEAKFDEELKQLLEGE